MKRLNKKQLATKEDYISSINKLKAELETEIEIFNEVMAEAWSAVETAIETYDSVASETWSEVDGKQKELAATIQEANNFINEIHSDMESYYDDKSDRWYESERGESYLEWKDQWEEELEFEEVEQPGNLDFYQPDSIDMPEINAGEVLEELPEEPEL